MTVDEPVGNVGAGVSFVLRGGCLQIVGDEDGEPGTFLEFLRPFLDCIDLREGYDAAALEGIQPFSELPFSAGGHPNEVRKEA